MSAHDLGDQQRDVLAIAAVVSKALAAGVTPESMFRFIAEVYTDPDAGEWGVPQVDLTDEQYVEVLAELFSASVLLLAQARDVGRAEVEKN